MLTAAGTEAVTEDARQAGGLQGKGPAKVVELLVAAPLGRQHQSSCQDGQVAQPQQAHAAVKEYQDVALEKETVQSGATGRSISQLDAHLTRRGVKDQLWRQRVGIKL